MEIEQRLTAVEKDSETARTALGQVLGKMDKSTDAIYKLVSNVELLIHKFDKMETIVDDHSRRIRTVEDNQLIKKSAWDTIELAKKAFVTALIAVVFSSVLYFIKVK